MEYTNKLGLGVGGVDRPGKRVLVYSGISSDIRDLAERFGIDDIDSSTLVFATIDSAVGSLMANRGDTIVVAPGHAETISSATALALDVAGINIIGLGEGTDRPTLTFDTANTATIAVSVANVTIENIVFSANFADIASLFTLTTAKNFKLKNCGFKATATNMNFLTLATTNAVANTADGLTVEGCTWIEPDTSTSTMLTIVEDLDGLIVKGNYLNLGVNTSDLPAIAIVATGKDLTNLRVEGNDVIRLNDANPLLIDVDTTTANTGIVKDNNVRHLDTAAELIVTAGTNIGFFRNNSTAAIDKSGFIIPVIDS